MGVPILFAWLNQKHPNCILKDPPKNVHNLYLDLNALIHNCYNPNLPSIQEIYEDMLDRMTKSIDDIVYRTNPSKILYIAVDGVAPGAKLAHQRGRRFRAAYERQENLISEPLSNLKDVVGDEQFEDILSDDEKTLADKFSPEDELPVEELVIEKSEKVCFDSNAITPGTELMEYLHNGLIDLLSYRSTLDPKYKNLKIIYSSYLVPGEGEQKIMTFIRKYHITEPKDNHVIFSPDGDVIFLGMGLYNVNFYIMRVDTYNTPHKKTVCAMCSKIGHPETECGQPEFLRYTYIDIPEFRVSMLRNFNFIIKTTFDKRRMIVDWIFVCSLIGNDFIPGIPALDIKISSIEALTNILCKNYVYKKEYITSNDKKINFHVLETFLISLGRLEDSYYVIKSRMLSYMCKEPNREEIPLQTRSGKIKYYSVKLSANNQNDVDNICIEYITGLIWVHNYYIYGRTDWEWVYPYHFAPFAVDLSKVVRAQFSLKTGRSLSPFEQLMVVIPPQSKNLVPSSFHYIYEKYKGNYPSKVHIDMFDKFLPWMGVVILPHMNSVNVFKEIKKNINNLSVDVLDRNIKDHDLLITSDSNIGKCIIGLYYDLRPAVKIDLEGIHVNTLPFYKATLLNEEVLYGNGESYVNKTLIARIEFL